MGNPTATPAAILKLVDSNDPPLRLALGSSAIGDFNSIYQSRQALADMSESRHLSAPGMERRHPVRISFLISDLLG